MIIENPIFFTLNLPTCPAGRFQGLDARKDADPEESGQQDEEYRNID